MTGESFTMEAVEPYSNTIPEITRKDGGNPLKTSVRIVGVAAEIGTKHLPNRNLQHCL
jgi:hypothetical protein